MNPGSQVAICGTATTIASSAMSATLKGSTPRNTVPIVRWRSRLFTTKMFIPTGGLMSPNCTTITVDMPDPTESKPEAVATGKKKGRLRGGEKVVDRNAKEPRPGGPGARGRDPERAPGAGARALGRGKNAGGDPADHDKEQQAHRPDEPHRLEPHRPGAALPRRAGLRLAPGHPHDGEAQEHRRHDARQEAGRQELAAIGLGHDAGDYHDPRGRHQDARPAALRAG